MVPRVQPSMEAACHPAALQTVLQDLLFQAVLQHLQADPMAAFLLLQVLQGPLCHRHLVALPLHLLLAPPVPLSALPWLQALVPPKEQSQTE